jgi:hypothetical protein
MAARIRAPRGPHADARLRDDARGRDGSVREKLGNGYGIARRRHIRFRGQTGKHLLSPSFTGFDPYRTPLLGKAACREFLPTILRRCRRPSRPRPEQAVADRAQKAASTINRGHDPRRVECAVAIGG